MKKIISIIVINIILLAGQLVLAMGRSVDGVSLSQLNSKWQQLRLENEMLAERVYTKSSLSYIASQSAKLDLASRTVRFISPQAYVAATRLSP